jgi:hypothetical protein
MADREIRVVGVFQDGITPTLNKLNRQLLGTLKQFEKLQSRIAPVAAEMEKFNSAASSTANNLKSQRSAIEENIRMLRAYRTELSKTATAQQRMGGGLPRPPRPVTPRGGGGGGAVPFVPRARGTTPGGGGGGGGGVEGLGAGVFGVTLGNQLASIITGAVVAGFQTGAQIMMAPFKFGAQALGERIRDEMSDVRTAGGLFSISKRMQQPIFGTFAEAEQYTKEQNRYLAKLAGSLPGDTQEYIQVSKQIADGIFTVVSQDAKNAQKLATQLAQERGATAQEIAKLSQGGPAAMQQTGKEIVGEMTKLTVLAGLGGRQGAYGLPQLTERMIGEDQISMGMFQRYAAIFRDPMIKGALERNVAEINKAGKNTTARLEAIRNTFREIVTPELVRRYQRTTAGVLEALRTTFLNPEVGILGLGRPLATTTKKFDEFGNQLFTLSRDIEINGKTVKKGSEITAHALAGTGYSLNAVAKAATDNLSIFDYLRDIFANLMIVLQPVIDNIVNIFDPLSKLGDVLAGMRERTMKFQNAFEKYRVYLEKTAKKMEGDAKAAFEGTIPFRAALAAINDAMRAYGGYGADSLKEFQDVAAQLEDPSTTPKQMGAIIKRMLDKFLSSDFAKKIGEALGTVVGTVVAQVGEMMKAAAGLATASKLAEGFASGFAAAGGPQGFRDIIRSVFALFGKLLIEVIKAAPLESAIAAALFFLPGAIAGVISQALSGGFATALAGGGGVKAALAGAKTKGGGLLAGAKNFLTKGPAGAGPGITKMGAGTGLGRIPAIASGVPKNFMAGLKAIGPKMLGLGGIISGVIALLEGKSILEAISTGLGSAGGTAIGAAIGTVIFPGIGTAIGAAIGGTIGTLEPVVQPLTSALGGLFGAIEPLGGILGQLWNDVTGVFNGIVVKFMELIGLGNTLGEGFNLLQFALFAVLSPFKLLQIGILGVYEAYLELKRRIPGLGLNKEEKEAYNRTVAARIKATDEFTIEGRQAAGFSIEQQKAAEYAKFKEAKQAGNKAEMNRIAQYMRVLNEKGGQGLPAAPSKQAGVDSPAQALKDLNQKQQTSTDALKQVDSSTKRTTEATRNLATKFSGVMAVRVVNLPTPQAFTFNPFAGAPRNPLTTPSYDPTGIGTITDGGPLPSIFQFQQKPAWPFAKGNFSTPLGKAISYEMRHKPPGSDLVIANSSETIIPAADGMIGPSWLPWNWGKLVDQERKTSPLNRTNRMLEEMRKEGGYGGSLYNDRTSSYMRTDPMPTMTASAGGGGGSFDVGKVEVTINDNSGDIAAVSDKAAEMILQSMYRQARAEVYTS